MSHNNQLASSDNGAKYAYLNHKNTIHFYRVQTPGLYT